MENRINHIIARVLSGESSSDDILSLSEWLNENEKNRNEFRRLKNYCAVLIQPHIQAEREATEDEIVEYMTALGFEMDYIDEFHNEEYEVFDALKR